MRVVSYNILADTYIRPEWYPDIPVELLDWSLRKDRLLQHLLQLDADVLCLQEVENYVYNSLYEELKKKGYLGLYGRKGFGRLDGCATFFRKKKLQFVGGRAIYFNDQGKDKKPSGHVALLLKLAWDERVVGIVNTHIKWSSPEKLREEHRGYVQVKELLDLHLLDEEVKDWILCGDFNAEDDTDVIQQVGEAGFKDVYGELQLPTMSREGLARIDYIFHTKGLESHPDLIEQLTEESLLPSSTQPSDHLAISANFTKT